VPGRASWARSNQIGTARAENFRRGVAADSESRLTPPGASSSAFPTPSRPVAGIVTDVWRDEEPRDRAGEAENFMNLLGVNSGLVVADIGAGRGYYTVRLARRVGPKRSRLRRGYRGRQTQSQWRSRDRGAVVDRSPARFRLAPLCRFATTLFGNSCRPM